MVPFETLKDSRGLRPSKKLKNKYSSMVEASLESHHCGDDFQD